MLLGIPLPFKCLNHSLLGLNVLRMINRPVTTLTRNFLEQHIFVEESQEENKNTISTMVGAHITCTKREAYIRSVQRCKVVRVFSVLLANLFVACWVKRNKVQ